jgi:hypothetical protein
VACALVHRVAGVAGAIQEALKYRGHQSRAPSTDSPDRDAGAALTEPMDLSISTSVAREWRS